MNVFVCLARVPDTAARIRIADDGRAIATDGLSWEISPYDEFALEAGVQAKERLGGTLTVLHVGEADFQKELRNALAKGADTAVHLKTNGPLGPATVSEILAEAIRPQMPAVVFCGKQAVDGDQGATGAWLAARLEVPVLTKVSHLELGESTLVAKREVEGAVQTLEAPVPCVISCEKGLNEPRRAGLKEIMGAKKKPLEVREVQAGEPRLELVSLSLPPERAPGRIVGEGADAVADLVTALRDEAKVL